MPAFSRPLAARPALFAARPAPAAAFHASPAAAVAEKIDGTAIAATVRAKVAEDTAALKAKYGDDKVPGLAVVLVGARPDSAKYVSMKKKAAKELGFHSIDHTLDEDTPQAEVERVVAELNADPAVHGILVQLPMPDHINQKEVLEAISADKDVDGFHPMNAGMLVRVGEELRQAKQDFDLANLQNTACTPVGCVELLDQMGVELSGKNVVVLGRSNIVGLPVALLLMHRNATVTVCHSRTENLPDVCRGADVLVAAIGWGEFVKGDWVKPGAVVIDVGVNFVDDDTRKSGRRMCGDVDYKAAREHASAITPVPGGVGPMTIAMLMRNTLINARLTFEAEAGGGK